MKILKSTVIQAATIQMEDWEERYLENLNGEITRSPTSTFFIPVFLPDCGANRAGSIAHGCGRGPGSRQAEHNPAPCTGRDR